MVHILFVKVSKLKYIYLPMCFLIHTQSERSGTNTGIDKVVRQNARYGKFSINLTASINEDILSSSVFCCFFLFYMFVMAHLRRLRTDMKILCSSRYIHSSHRNFIGIGL